MEKTKKRVGPTIQGQNPTFSPWKRGKIGILRGYCGVQKFNKVIMPRVIPKAEEANTILRSPYTQIVTPERRAMATSIAHTGGGHIVEEELQRGG